MRNFMTLRKAMAVVLAVGCFVTSVPATPVSAEAADPYDIGNDVYVESSISEEPSYVEPTSAEIIYLEPTSEEPVYQDPIAYVEPAYVEPTYVEPTYVEPAYVEPTYVEPTYQDPTYVEPASAEPVYETATLAEPVYYEEPTTAQPTSTFFLYEDDLLKVEVTLYEKDALPADTRLIVKQISPENPELFEDEEYLRWETEDQKKDRLLYEWTDRMLTESLEDQELYAVNSLIYDLYYEQNGERLMPEGPFRVYFEYKEEKVLNEDADQDNVRFLYLDDNEITRKVDAVDTRADLKVNEKGSVKTAEFYIGRYRHTPLVVSMLETKEAHEKRLEEEAEEIGAATESEAAVELATEEAIEPAAKQKSTRKFITIEDGAAIVNEANKNAIKGSYEILYSENAEETSVLLSALLNELQLRTSEDEDAIIGIEAVESIELSASEGEESDALKLSEISSEEDNEKIRDWKITLEQPFEGSRLLNLTITDNLTVQIELTACRVYTVIWENWNGESLKTDQVKEGDTPVYGGTVPIREQDSQYTYTFSGWKKQTAEEMKDPEETKESGGADGSKTDENTENDDVLTKGVVPVTGDVTYVAQFQESSRDYTITWINDDGTELKKTDVLYGEVPVYDGTTPEKEPTVSIAYTFSGWEPEIAAVTGEATYKATYTEEPRKYTITWQNDDGSLIKTTQVPYGDIPVYDGETPVKTSSSTEEQFTFSHWSPEIVKVTGDAVYTAQYVQAVLELLLHDGSAEKTPIIGAEFALYNDESSSTEPVWTGITDERGTVRLCKVEDETNQTGKPDYEKGAEFQAGSSYTLKQLSTDGTKGFICPVGSWTVKVDGTGSVEDHLIRNSVWPDYTTPEASEKYGIRFELTNARYATLTYIYNMPAGNPKEDVTEILTDLSYNLNYTIDIEDPSAEGYEFVGWLDENNNPVKKGDAIIINTVSTREHELRGCWRAPLSVSARSYSGGRINSATEVEGSADVFKTTEIARTYTNLQRFCEAYGEQNPAVAGLNQGQEYAFVQAVLVPAAGESFLVTALHYDVTDHTWQYRKETAATWTNLSPGDQVVLYYARNRVNVVWVRETNGTFARLDSAAFPDRFIQIGNTNLTEADLYALIGTNAREAIVEEDCYFQYFGLGIDNANRDEDLILGKDQNLQSFRIRNTINGFVGDDFAEGIDITGLTTIYLVYSPTRPENSTLLKIHNDTWLDYEIDTLTINGVDLISGYRAILQQKDDQGNVTGLSIYDGESSAKHTGTTLKKNGDEIELVLLDAAGEHYELKGGFLDTDSMTPDYQVDVAIASAETNAVTHSLLSKEYKLPTGDILNQLSDTSESTEGTLDSQEGLVTIAFDDDLAPFMIHKKWSADAYPDALTVYFEVYEIPDTSLEEAPAGFDSNGKNDAATLRIAGATVYSVNLSDRTIRSKDGWNYTSQMLPKRNLYYAVESSIQNGDEPDARFQASYALTKSADGGWEQTITNSRVGAVCRVGTVEFETIQRAVDYIVTNQPDKNATIEMLCDYVMSDTYTDPKTGESETAIVTIPEGYDITLTTAMDKSTVPLAVSRGYNGVALFTVRNGSSLTLQNLTLSAITDRNNNFYQNNSTDSKAGFVLVENGGTLTVSEGATLTNGRAKYGSAVYIEDGGKAVFTGGTVTANRTTGEDVNASGAVAVGGVNSRIELSGKVVINNNRSRNGNDQRNIYLDQDSHEVIKVTGNLDDTAAVGVYVPGGDIYNAHGLPSKPFAIYVPDEQNTAPENLDSLLSDRYRNEAGKGYASTVLENTVVWGPTFELVTDIQWLDETYAPLSSIPAGAQVQISLAPVSNKGHITREEDRNQKIVDIQDGVMRHTFEGLAVYDVNGNLCEYYVKQEQILVPAEGYKQIKFIGDVGVKKLDENDGDSKNKNIPLKYNQDMAAHGAEHKVTLYEHRDETSFTITKIGENLEDGQTLTSTFELYGVRKGLGIATSADLPMGLRLADTPAVWSNVWQYEDDQTVTLSASTALFQVGGGNQWYCQVADGTLTGAQMQSGIRNCVDVSGANLVKFHTFYDYESRLFTEDNGAFKLNAGEWQTGDVILYNDVYRVYTGSGWQTLTSDGTAEPVISYTRQDGTHGALNKDGGMQLAYDIKQTKDENEQPILITTSISDSGDNTGTKTITKLSSEYYWFAVETSVTEHGGQNRTLSGMEWIVAAYNPQYVYDQANQNVTVTNTLRNGVAVYKKWPENSSGGKASFAVYKINDGKEPFEQSDLKTILNNAYGKTISNLTPVASLDFELPTEEGSYVYVIPADLIHENARYFIKEVKAEGLDILSADVQGASDDSADCVYLSYERPNNQSGGLGLYTVQNQNPILCKVVDPNGTEHVFRTIRAAYTYGKSNVELFHGEFTIEMLKDYSIPAGDVLKDVNNADRFSIESGMAVTITTADENYSKGKEYTYRAFDETDGRATITRSSGNNETFFQVNGGTLILENIIFDGNQANTGKNGGIVSSGATAGSVVLRSADSANPSLATGVLIRNSKGSNGGAVYVGNGDVNAEWTRFENCTATGNSNNDYGGGAIYVKTGKATVSNAEFSDCSVTRNGGAIAVINAAEADVSEIINSKFERCISSNYGGAVYSSGFVLNVSNCAFNQCEARYWGGAIAHYKNEKNASTIVTNSTFLACKQTANSHDNDGGGAINTKAGELHVSDSRFEDCYAYRRGGAIQQYLESGQTNILLTEVTNSQFYRCESQISGGGAMCVAGFTVHVKDCTFEECKAWNSAGGALDIAAHAYDKVSDVSDSTFTNCYSKLNGGAISMASGEMTASNCIFNNCESASSGGAVSMEAQASAAGQGIYRELHVYGCRFTDCLAVAYGGAIYTRSLITTIGGYVDETGETVFSRFIGCRTGNSNSGGGALCQDYAGGQDTSTGITPSVTVNEVLFESCQAVYQGGAIRTNARETTVEFSDFKDCKVVRTGGEAFGGALYTSNANEGTLLTVSDSHFTDCRTEITNSSGSGGAIYTYARTVNVQKGFFEGCSSAYGGGILQNNNTESQITLTASAFKSCSVTSGVNSNPAGGGLYTNAVHVAVSDCDFRDCTAVKNGNTVYGGGMFVNNETLGTRTTIRGTKFVNCRAENTGNTNALGGAVYTASRYVEISDYTDADGNVSSCVFHNDITNGSGGGIYHATTQDSYVRTELKISNANYENCTAVYYGGGIRTNAVTVNVENSGFTGCKVETPEAINSDTLGGGIYVSNGGENSITTLKGVRFERCEAATVGRFRGYGGSAYVYSRTLRVEDYLNADEQVIHSSFKDGRATHSGGAIMQNNNNVLSSMTMTGAVFENCDAVWGGGGIRGYALKNEITGCIFENCRIEYDGRDSNYGGALRIENTNAGSQLVIRGSEFDHCYSNIIGYNNSYGGTIFTTTKVLRVEDYVDSDGVTHHSAIKNSHSQNNGGGIYHNNNAADSMVSLNNLTLENCYSSDGRGGGVYTLAKTLELSETTVKNCYANKWGGGVYHDKSDATVIITGGSFEDCYTVANADAGGGGLYTNAIKLDISDVAFLRCFATAFRGGGLYYGNNDNGELSIKDAFFEDCYCASNMHGGAIYIYAKKGTLSDTVIDGNTDGSDRINAKWGGGIYNDRAEMILTGTTIRNCAAGDQGGGLFQNSAYSRNVVLDNTTIADNSAVNNGGGVYFAPNSNTCTLTIRRGTIVTGNQLTTMPATPVNYGAGIYLYQDGVNARGTLVVGDEELPSDTITVWDNTLPDGSQSNVRLNSANPYDNKVYLRFNNRMESVKLYSDLVNSKIGVVNPGIPSSRFGTSIPSNHNGAGAFVSDDQSMTGRINSSNTEQIIWYKPPVCKITDASGRVLTYVSEGSSKLAVYDSLTAAIQDFNGGNSESGYFYDGVTGHESIWVEPAQIQMLTPSYTLTGVDASLPAFTRSAIVTTAEAGDPDQNYYPSGAPDAVITSASGGSGIFSAVGNINLVINHLTLDGGNASTGVNGGLIRSQGAHVILGQDTVLRNAVTTGNGGAVYLSDGATLEMTMNASIRNCSANNGGGVYVQSGSSVKMTYRASLTGCSAENKGGAMYVAGGASADLDGTVDSLSIKNNHVSDTSGGAGIYLAAGSSAITLNGRLDFAGNTVTTANDPGSQNGAEAYSYARQDLYLAANIRNDVASITIAGNLTNGHGDDGFIWVWPQNENHYKKDDQFANIKPGVVLQRFTLNAFRDAREDAVTGNDVGQYYTGVLDPSDGNRVLWGVDIVDAVFLKTDGSGRVLEGAVFTVYANTGSESDLQTPLRYRNGTTVAPRSGTDGTVEINDVLRRGRTYYMKETSVPAKDANGQTANFGSNENLYLITITANDDVMMQVQNGSSWEYLEKNSDGIYVIKNEPVICKVVDQSGTEHPFGTLNAAVTYIRDHKAVYIDGTAAIQMLVDYTVPFNDLVELQDGDNITLTTAHTTATKVGDERYLYVGENGQAAILRRGSGYPASSMVTASGSGGFELENITLDGRLNGRTQRASANGGFISLSGTAHLTIGTGATLQNANTTGNGGAVYAGEGTSVTVNGGVIQNCAATGNGGGICALGSLVLGGDHASVMTNCSASNGGAVYIQGAIDALPLTNFSISGGSASANGGAIYLESGASSEVHVTLVNSKLGASDHYNTAGRSGGSLYTKADRVRIAVDGTSVIGYGRTTSSASANGGGAVAHIYDSQYENSSFTLTGVMQSETTTYGSISNSASSASGGGMDVSAQTVTIDGVTVTSCESSGSGSNAGGGIYIRQADTVSVKAVIITGCSSATNGGGIAMPMGGTLILEDDTMTLCTAPKSGGKGGGVYAVGTDVTVESCTFGVDNTNYNTRYNNRCQASSYGGAIYLENGTLNIDRQAAQSEAAETLLSGCMAGTGGGVYATGNSTANIYGAFFKYCSGSGGGIGSYNSIVAVDEVIFTGCSGVGGGMNVESSDVTVTGCSFISCSGNYGGGIRVRGMKNGSGLTIQDKISADGSSLIPTEFRGCKATWSSSYGSALHIEDTSEVYITGHTTITMKLNEADESSETVRGCAVYVAGGGMLHFGCGDADAPSITDYCLSNTNENGAGICLGFSDWNKYGKLTLQGAPTFDNNLSGASYNGQLGGEAYSGRVRQDIYVNMSGVNDVNKKNTSGLQLITINGELTSPNGIYVFVTDDRNKSSLTQGDHNYKHFMEGDQFGITANTSISDDTLALFRNARLDGDTNNTGNSMLIGVRGDEENQVYWGSQDGFNVVFRKINGYGEALNGAAFTLYMSNEEGTQILTNGSGQRVICQVSGSSAYAVSGQGTASDIQAGRNAAHAVTIKVQGTTSGADNAEDRAVYGDGLVVFEKIPAGTYFLAETAYPAAGQAANGQSYVGAFADNADETLYKVVVDSKGWYHLYAPSGFSSRQAVWKTTGTETAADQAPTSLFVRTGDAYTAPTASVTASADTLSVYTIMNVSPVKRKVILKKAADQTFKPLEGAQFRIFRADLSEVKNADYNENVGYTSLASGVYFIDELPEGKYYLVETKAPSGAAASNQGKVFTLVVKDGMVKQISAPSGERIAVGSNLLANLRNWASYQPTTNP